MKFKSILLSFSLISIVGATSAAAMPNPAAKYCNDVGGQLEIVKLHTGDQTGLCTLGQASIEEWTLFRRKRLGTLSQAVSAFCKSRAPNSGGEGYGIQIGNPASQNCSEQGGSLEIAIDRSGNEMGICKFGDKSSIEEWTLFRGAHS